MYRVRLAAQWSCIHCDNPISNRGALHHVRLAYILVASCKRVRKDIDTSLHIEEPKPHKFQLEHSFCHAPAMGRPEFAGDSLPFPESPPLIEHKISCPHPNRDVFSVQHPAISSRLDYRMLGTM